MEKIKGWFRRFLEGVVSPHALFLVAAALMVVGAHHVMGLWLYVVAIGVLIPYVVLNWKKLRRTRWKDWINPVKWVSVLYAGVMSVLFPKHVVEQLMLRLMDNECKECVARGSCTECGCDMSKVYVPWEKCSKGNWGAMIMSKRRYAELREANPVMWIQFFGDQIKKASKLTAELQGPKGGVEMDVRRSLSRVVTYLDLDYKQWQIESNDLPHNLHIRGRHGDIDRVLRVIRSVWHFLEYASAQHGILTYEDFRLVELRTLARKVYLFDQFDASTVVEIDYGVIYYTVRDYLENIVLKEHPDIQTYKDFRTDELRQLAIEVKLFG